MLHHPLSCPQDSQLCTVEILVWEPPSPSNTTDSASPPTWGTDIITLLNTVHYDPSQFLTPWEFNPEHFLVANQSFKKSPAFMPFSAGESGQGQDPVFLATYSTCIPQA